MIKIENTDGLKKYAMQRSKIALNKVENAIFNLYISEKKINFNNVSKVSGVSKTFLYNNKEIRERIEELRNNELENSISEVNNEIKKSKKDLISIKNKKIKELKIENKKLKEQLEILRGKLYDEFYIK